jgi:cyclohexanecarboxylate-CoA ligase
MPEGTDPAVTYRERGWWRDQTFLDDLRRFAARTPDRPVLIGHRDDAARVVDYAELARLTDVFAAKLAGLGVRRGDVVAVQLPNWWELLPLGLACARIGAIFCPLMIIYRRREIDFILRLTKARVCVTMAEWDGARLGDVVAGIAADLPSLEHVLVAGGAGRAGTLSFESYFFGGTPGQADRPGAEELGPDEPFLMLFTSGTTGEPKGVLHSQNTLYASASAYADVLDQGAETVTFISHVATHYSGLVTGMLTSLLRGGSTLLLDSWNARTYLEVAPKYKVTTFYGAPNFLVDLLAAQGAGPADLTGLRYIISGSAPIPPPVLERIRANFDVSVLALWGMTENGATTMTRPDDPPDWAEHSDGRPLGGMEVRIDTSGLPASPGGSGVFKVRGPSQCLGYFERDQLYADCVDDDGWFDTGDLARDDGRGGIRISGRVKDIVVARSINVPVPEVESALLRHAQVRDVAVVGIQTDVDEVACAVVVPQGQPPTLRELCDHLGREGFSELFWPGRLELTGELPRTITGKVRKVDLRERYRLR